MFMLRNDEKLSQPKHLWQNQRIIIAALQYIGLPCAWAGVGASQRGGMSRSGSPARHRTVILIGTE